MNVPSWPMYRATIMRSKELNRLMKTKSSECKIHKFPINHTNNHTNNHTTITMWLNRSTHTAHNQIRPDQTIYKIPQDIYTKNHSMLFQISKQTFSLPMVFLLFALFFAAFSAFHFGILRIIKRVALPISTITFLWHSLFHNKKDSTFDQILWHFSIKLSNKLIWWILRSNSNFETSITYGFWFSIREKWQILPDIQIISIDFAAKKTSVRWRYQNCCRFFLNRLKH